MKPSLHQRATLRHELRMNPRLYQAMDLLYMPLLDLEVHLKTELLANPFLEMAEDEEELPPETTAEEQQEQEREEKEKEDEIDWEEILLDGFQVGGAKPEYEDREVHERVSVSMKDLADHLRDQLVLSDLAPRDQILADEFIGNIGEDGYLKASLEEIVSGANNTLQLLAQGTTENWKAPGALSNGASDEDDAGDADATDTTATPDSAHEPMIGAGGADGAGGPVEWIGAEIPAHAKVIGNDEATDEGAPAVAANPGAETDRAALAVDTEAAEAAEAAEPESVSLDDVDIPWFDLDDAERLLARIQELDPPGVAARDLRECLLLQLRDQGYHESLTFKLVNEAFDDLISHRWSDLAKKFGLEPRAVQDAADLLAKFDPKPGLRFQVGDDGYVTPDLIMEKVDGEYRIFLNDAGMPRLRISRVYQDLAGDKKKFQGENRDFVTSKLNSATWLIQAIEQRRQTMLKVMNFIADRQRDFFEKGVEHLRPLTLREVADVINMHESTVSRVTNQKYVQTPRGVLPLKFFFSSSLGTASGEDASARSVKAQIQKLVDDEDTHKPLTDSDLVKALQARGIKIARRTVAKYRDQLGILPARMRKRV